MDIDVLKKRLQGKEQELLAEMAQHETEAREAPQSGVLDPMDQVVSSENKEEQFQQASANWQLIGQIRDALSRMDNGTYGLCTDCGQRIDAARLEAIPWTPYCADDQNRRDRESHPEGIIEPTL